MFLGRNDAKAGTPVLWPPHAKSWLIGKDSDAGRDWGQEEKGTTEDEMSGWLHRLYGHESEWTPGDGQGGLACCDSWGRKELDTTEWLNWTELNWCFFSAAYTDIQSITMFCQQFCIYLFTLLLSQSFHFYLRTYYPKLNYFKITVFFFQFCPLLVHFPSWNNPIIYKT